MQTEINTPCTARAQAWLAIFSSRPSDPRRSICQTHLTQLRCRVADLPARFSANPRDGGDTVC